MSHFAKVENGVVTNVIVAEQDFIDTGAMGDPSLWIQTSYNTYLGVHYAPNSNTPDGGVALRKNYASLGYTYDTERDAFIPPKPFPSWVLNEDTCDWDAPTSRPDDGENYIWDEENTSWKQVPNSEMPDDGKDYYWDEDTISWKEI